MAAKSSLVQNAAWRFASTIALAATSLVTVPVFARILGMDQWGLLALFQAATAPFALLDLGTGTATVKYVAEAIGRGDREEATRTFQTALIFSLATGALGALALLLGAEWLSSSVFAIPPAMRGVAAAGFRLTGLNWFSGVLAATFAGVLTAHGLYGRASRLRALGGLGSGVAGVLAVFAGGGLLAVVVAQTVTSLAMACLWFAAASRTLPGIAALPRWDARLFRRGLTFGSWQAVAAAGGLVAGWSDRYIAGSLLSTAAVGVYAIAFSIYSAAYGAFHDMGEVLFPAASQNQGAGNLSEARRTSVQAGWALSTVFAVTASAIAAVGGDFISLWVSPEAAGMGGPVLRLLIVAGTLGVAITGPFFLCLGIGRVRPVALTSLASAAAVLGLGMALVPRLGLNGVAWAIIGGVAVQWVLLLNIARSVYAPEVRLGEFVLYIFTPSCVGVAVLCSVVELHDWLAGPPSWPGLFLETFLSAALAAALQAVANEALPGGRQRRMLFRSLLVPLGIKLGHGRRGGLSAQ